ncbi:putative WRKY transcription factor 28 [Hibiscus syriacus]|uniref:WRKY transcription factor 28 n=1 Tax=Hibiscus syriacus TaxID=106335 RepID=A0A6A3A5P9_HIBSY|nr:WRKY transcription factor 23-like [Hibiscus syriacus]KAE8699661.1 putative WRKY transcription factor 28 [Hibiscus syriacus]
MNNFPLQSTFDLCSSEDEKIRSLGFMDLLGVQDLIGPPFLEIMAAQQVSTPPSKKIESPEVINQPATPKFSSISSASSEAVNDEPVKEDDQEENQQKTKKQLKPKKTNQKRQREPRFAFMTKSEVDHLEDGYRWRKYGQKAVKNSPFPRSYYRCTTASCNVKKRVERSFSDPSIVVTTYEGQHTHPSPIMPHPSLCGSHLTSPISAFGMPTQKTPPHYQHQHQQRPFTDNIGSMNARFLHEKLICSTSVPGPSLLKDHGLLQDILPSHMLKE